MDEVDRSDREIEVALQHYINKIRHRATYDIRPTGFCLNCAEDCGGKLFCDSECREDYERREHIHRNHNLR